MPFGSSVSIAQNGALYSARNTVCDDNGAGEVLYQYASTTLIRPSTGGVIYAGNLYPSGAGYGSADITVAGPTPGGRDQAAAFPVNSLVHFYVITNGSIAAGIASLSPPIDLAPAVVVNGNISTLLLGPTLPAGFTHWTYIGMIPMNGAALHPASIRNEKTYFKTPITQLNNGGAVADTDIPITGGISLSYGCILSLKASVLTNAGGAAASEASFIAGANQQIALNVGVPAASQEVFNTSEIITQIIDGGSGELAYRWQNDVNAANIAARRLTVKLIGFVNPYFRG